MEIKEIISTNHERALIDKYVDGQISGKMFNKITDIHDKYKDAKTDDVYINYLQAFFSDKTKEMLEFKKQICKKTEKKYKKSFVSRKMDK